MKIVKLKNSEIQIIRHALYAFGNSPPGEPYREVVADAVQKLNEAVVDEADTLGEVEEFRALVDELKQNL